MIETWLELYKVRYGSTEKGLEGTEEVLVAGEDFGEVSYYTYQEYDIKRNADSTRDTGDGGYWMVYSIEFMDMVGVVEEDGGSKKEES